jgi:hypothetical protein
VPVIAVRRTALATCRIAIPRSLGRREGVWSREGVWKMADLDRLRLDLGAFARAIG